MDKIEKLEFKRLKQSTGGHFITLDLSSTATINPIDTCFSQSVIMNAIVPKDFWKTNTLLLKWFERDKGK
ncbi:hypothetical protein [Lysinibacillus sp. K60]|uniref:hypothetical protein n=1 Tax=Lysinibacillus sp. K60 TaxID=2720027 RepID=UPI001C8CE916|nr:hypothetical protein [Lysinibacillus sp. K60]MBX8945852.1 hypothetical protein [Lysinibacillus sp. K60]